jgi:hypothetical protein
MLVQVVEVHGQESMALVRVQAEIQIKFQLLEAAVVVVQLGHNLQKQAQQDWW